MRLLLALDHRCRRRGCDNACQRPCAGRASASTGRRAQDCDHPL